MIDFFFKLHFVFDQEFFFVSIINIFSEKKKRIVCQRNKIMTDNVDQNKTKRRIGKIILEAYTEDVTRSEPIDDLCDDDDDDDDDESIDSNDSINEFIDDDDEISDDDQSWNPDEEELDEEEDIEDDEEDDIEEDDVSSEKLESDDEELLKETNAKLMPRESVRKVRPVKKYIDASLLPLPKTLDATDANGGGKIQWNGCKKRVVLSMSSESDISSDESTHT
jgi:hypothetical protein